METKPNKHASDRDEAKHKNSLYQNDNSVENEATEDDGTPILDEYDLEENDIDDDAVDDIEWNEANA